MTSKFIYALDKNYLSLPSSQKWIKDNLQYECIMGSQAYGVNQDNSDLDIYGWCIPPKEILFPHLAGHIDGFGTQPVRFEQLQNHHVKSEDIEYDFTIYNIVKYFQLVLENNPNMIDSLFVPNNCVTHMTPAASILRTHRKEFLHKGAYVKFKGYAYSQMHKMRIQRSDTGENMSTKRRTSIEKHGYDIKFAYHLIRLINECEQILMYGDIDLQANREQLKSIRRGEFKLEQILEMVEVKEPILDKLHAESKLRLQPDWKEAKSILMEILETHYGSLAAVVKTDNSAQILRDLNNLIARYS